MEKNIIIFGAGEQATGTAHRLFRSGFQVIMTELPHPLVVRRTVSFADAVFKGSATVEGVSAQVFSFADWVKVKRSATDYIPVIIDPNHRVLQSDPPDVLIDARLMKANCGLTRDMAPLVIGLGPGMSAGENVDIAIETNRGHNLGRIIYSGPTEPNTGVPGEVVTGKGTHSLKRVLRAPCSGIFKSVLKISDMIEQGQTVGYVDSKPVISQIGGVLRGQIHPGTTVTKGLKIGDVDPRFQVEACWTLSDKARTISGAVLESILSWKGN